MTLNESKVLKLSFDKNSKKCFLKMIINFINDKNDKNAPKNVLSAYVNVLECIGVRSETFICDIVNDYDSTFFSKFIIIFK